MVTNTVAELQTEAEQRGIRLDNVLTVDKEVRASNCRRGYAASCPRWWRW